MRLGFPISLLLHALILGWSLIAMTSTRDFKKPDIQPIALEIITAEELAQMRKGDEKSKELNATAAKDSQGKAEKDPPKPKVTAAAPPPPPPPAAEPAPPEPVKTPPKEEPRPDDVLKEMAKTEPKPPPPEPKPEPAPAPAPKEEPKPDDVLKEMAKTEPKPPPLPPAKPPEPPKAAEKPPEKKPTPPKPKPAPKLAEAKPAPAPPKPSPAHRPSTFEEQMRKAGLQPDDAPPDPLLNKDPRRQLAMQSTASTDPVGKPKTAAGARDGQGQKVTQNEMAALARQLAGMIKGCYRAQAGNAIALEDLVVKLRFDLTPDGMLRGEPIVLEAARFSLGTQWAVNALKGCQPYRLDPDKYQAWKEWDFIFQP